MSINLYNLRHQASQYTDNTKMPIKAGVIRELLDHISVLQRKIDMHPFRTDTGPYRTDTEPCVECARREAEGPKQAWWQAADITWRKVGLSWLFGVIGVVFILTVQDLLWREHQPRPEPYCYVQNAHGMPCLYLRTGSMWDEDRSRKLSCANTVAEVLEDASRLGCPTQNK